MSAESSSTGSGFARFLDRTSGRLFARARLGDSSALNDLFRRYLPALRRWAHGRLPRWVRTAADTTDLIHDAVLHTIRRLDTLELRGQQALAAYLREAVRNRIRDEHRHFSRHGTHSLLPEGWVDSLPSPVERAISHEVQERYRGALIRLRPGDRELIIGHLELDYTHEQLGCMTGRTRNAARMALQRAIRRLAKQMAES